MLEKYIFSDANYSCHGIDEISSYLSVQARCITEAASSHLALSSLLMEESNNWGVVDHSKSFNWFNPSLHARDVTSVEICHLVILLQLCLYIASNWYPVAIL